MKAFTALILAAALLAPTVHAQETPAAPAPQETAPAPESPAAAEPAPAPAPAAAPAAESKPAPDLTPAQDIPMPKKETGLDLMPAQDTPQIIPEPVLIPESPTSMPKPEGSAIEEPKEKKEKLKQDKTAAAADEMASRVRYRQAKTRALKDPAVQAEWAKAARARTDYEKREALTNYYTLLYARMEKLDKSLKKEIESRQGISLRRLRQSRLEPTEAPTVEEAPEVSSRDSGQFFE